VFNRLDHSWLGDLEVRLTSPSGRVATLLKSQFQSGGGLLGSQDNFLNTVMDDQRLVNLANGTAPFTGSYNINHASIGNNPLSVFNGEIATGTWRVSIRDWAGSDVGKLYDWSLMFTGIDLNPGDEYEPNNSFPQAVNLGMLGEVSQTGLSIHKPTDRDFYRFQAGASTTAELRVLWGQPSVNLDFILYDSSLSEIARSESLSGDEILPYEVVANET
jgi:subtilisin-like proprotein convertase family protein